MREKLKSIAVFGIKNAIYGLIFLLLLTVVFIVLKMLDEIIWPWWVVMMPFYGGLILAFTIMALAAHFETSER